MAKSRAVIKLDDRILKELVQKVGKASVKKRIIADGVEYGIHQEFTSRGHPSLVPAFETVTRELPAAVGKAIEKRMNPDDVAGKAAFDIAAMWAADVNVDTGAYKNSIHVEDE